MKAGIVASFTYSLGPCSPCIKSFLNELTAGISKLHGHCVAPYVNAVLQWPKVAQHHDFCPDNASVIKALHKLKDGILSFQTTSLFQLPAALSIHQASTNSWLDVHQDVTGFRRGEIHTPWLPYGACSMWHQGIHTAAVSDAFEEEGAPSLVPWQHSQVCLYRTQGKIKFDLKMGPPEMPRGLNRKQRKRWAFYYQIEKDKEGRKRRNQSAMHSNELLQQYTDDGHQQMQEAIKQSGRTQRLGASKRVRLNADNEKEHLKNVGGVVEMESIQEQQFNQNLKTCQTTLHLNAENGSNVLPAAAINQIQAADTPLLKPLLPVCKERLAGKQGVVEQEASKRAQQSTPDRPRNQSVAEVFESEGGSGSRTQPQLQSQELSVSPPQTPSQQKVSEVVSTLAPQHQPLVGLPAVPSGQLHQTKTMAPPTSATMITSTEQPQQAAALQPEPLPSEQPRQAAVAARPSPPPQEQEQQQRHDTAVAAELPEQRPPTAEVPSSLPLRTQGVAVAAETMNELNMLVAAAAPSQHKSGSVASPSPSTGKEVEEAPPPPPVQPRQHQQQQRVSTAAVAPSSPPPKQQQQAAKAKVSNQQSQAAATATAVRESTPQHQAPEHNTNVREPTPALATTVNRQAQQRQRRQRQAAVSGAAPPKQGHPVPLVETAAVKGLQTQQNNDHKWKLPPLLSSSIAPTQLQSTSVPRVAATAAVGSKVDGKQSPIAKPTAVKQPPIAMPTAVKPKPAQPLNYSPQQLIPIPGHRSDKQEEKGISTQEAAALLHIWKTYHETFGFKHSWMFSQISQHMTASVMKGLHCAEVVLLARLAFQTEAVDQSLAVGLLKWLDYYGAAYIARRPADISFIIYVISHAAPSSLKQFDCLQRWCKNLQEWLDATIALEPVVGKSPKGGKHMRQASHSSSETVLDSDINSSRDSIRMLTPEDQQRLISSIAAVAMLSHKAAHGLISIHTSLASHFKKVLGTTQQAMSSGRQLPLTPDTIQEVQTWLQFSQAVHQSHEHAGAETLQDDAEP